jgi:hypothetical protein
MKSTHSQRGSSHVIIIVLLVALLIGALGYILWQNVMNQPANESVTNSDTTQTTPESATEGELPISEWGVKGSYDSSETIGYRINQFGSATVYYGNGSEDDCEVLGSISRSLADDDAIVGSTFSGYTTQEAFEMGLGDARSQVGEYYYLYTGPQTNECSSESFDADRQLEADEAVEQLVSSFEEA